MINIRRSLFETNSSSTHAMCIARDNNELCIPDELEFVAGEFGWEERFYYTTEEKASYLYTAILCTYMYRDNQKEVENIKNHIYELLGEHGCEATFVEPTKSSWGGYDFYIDHSEGLGSFVNKITKNDRALLRFLFSSDSFVVTGNDNSDWFRTWEDEFEFSAESEKVNIHYKGN